MIVLMSTAMLEEQLFQSDRHQNYYTICNPILNIVQVGGHEFVTTVKSLAHNIEQLGDMCQQHLQSCSSILSCVPYSCFNFIADTVHAGRCSMQPWLVRRDIAPG